MITRKRMAILQYGIRTPNWKNGILDMDSTDLFRGVYDSLSQNLDPKSVPQAILIIAGYQYKAAFVADQEINTIACLTEIMANCKFK